MSDKNISPATHLMVRGARQHNLKNIDLDLPKGKLVVFTGLSGSGKSSMAYDTVYAEGQRRYVESLSSYARQFLGVMDKPEVDKIEGLSPAISIDQKGGSHNPRSTVGTVTEIYDYLRLLYARVGHPHCPECGKEITTTDAEQITEQVWDSMQEAEELHENKGVRLMVLSPVVRHQKGQFKELFKNLEKKGFTQARIDNKVFDFSDDFDLVKTNYHDIEVVIDKLVVPSKELKGTTKESKNRLFEAIEQALGMSEGMVVISVIKDKGFSLPDKPEEMVDQMYSEKFACTECGVSLPEIEPRTFSFNSPEGACEECSGLGTQLKVKPDLVLAEDLTLDEGAIIPLASQFQNNTWRARLIRTVAEEHGFDSKTAIVDLDDEQLNVLLNGTGDETYLVKGENRQGQETTWESEFEGILKEIETRHEETSSDYVRNELEKFMIERSCPVCKGTRLKKEALSITINDFSIAEVTAMPIEETLEWAKGLPEALSNQEITIAKSVLEEVESRLKFLVSVGLDYVTLDREAGTLAGGELQRIRLASQIGSQLTGILYVLDEPTIGLHQRDNKRLIDTLKNLRDLGNTLLVVEHDREMIESADQIIEFGPGAGKEGGRLQFQGSVEEMKKERKTLTSKYLTGEKKVLVDTDRKLNLDMPNLRLFGASLHNLKNVDLEIPLGRFVTVTGVSGSGKSSLIVETLHEALARNLKRRHQQEEANFEQIMIPDAVRKVSLIDQSPIGRTPRSNPATYTKAFNYIRKLFASTQEAEIRGYDKGRFSFNVKGGRCEACQGQGQNKIEMQFMSDIYVTCEVCEGKRYNSPTLEVKYKGKNIAEVLKMTVDEAVGFFNGVPALNKRLKTMQDVGLGYIELGQPAPTLSGGEAQRIKLAAELAKTRTGHTIYILDEPTTGLHFEDLRKLLKVLHRLVDQDNTVVVIEHNLDLINNADWIIDLGPGGGHKGGEIIATGKPETIASNDKSVTGEELRKYWDERVERK